ncbi:MAG: hypothetical protein JWQ99_2374, partial [Blastococcus sp.]|nr:hypothetical protein [Blastococcus sp.]
MSQRTVGGPRSRGAVVAMLAAVAMTLGSTQAQLSRSGPPVAAATCVAVGATVNSLESGDGDKLPLFSKAVRSLGPLTVRRSFDSGLPRTFAASAAAGDEAAGLNSFVSWKPPRGDHRGAAAGRYDKQITTWAESVPRTGIYATSFHEPENNMSAREFVAFQRHVYTVVKAANPTIRWGPVYMAYWWDPQETGHFIGNPEDWWPGDGYADFAALDWYSADPEPMTTSGSFRFWYQTMVPTGLPLLITEYGQYAVGPGERRVPEKETRRAEVIREDAAWIADHPRISMWLYWQGVGEQGDWRLRDEP